MYVTALILLVLAAAAIIVLGARFVVAPRVALTGFGIAPEAPRALTEIKGVRDITSGVVALVALAAGGNVVFGWVMVAAALTAAGDAAIVLTNGGKRAAAWGMHLPTAAVLVAAGLVLALG